MIDCELELIEIYWFCYLTEIIFCNALQVILFVQFSGILATRQLYHTSFKIFMASVSLQGSYDYIHIYSIIYLP